MFKVQRLSEISTLYKNLFSIHSKTREFYDWNMQEKTIALNIWYLFSNHMRKRKFKTPLSLPRFASGNYTSLPQRLRNKDSVRMVDSEHFYFHDNKYTGQYVIKFFKQQKSKTFIHLWIVSSCSYLSTELPNQMHSLVYVYILLIFLASYIALSKITNKLLREYINLAK